MPHDLIAHYKAVRERITRQPFVTPGRITLPPRPIPQAAADPVPPPPRPEVFMAGCRSIVARKLIEPILARHGFTWVEIIGPDRRAIYKRCRREVWAALHEAGLSLSRIGRTTNRDHSTICHGLKAHYKEQNACLTSTQS